MTLTPDPGGPPHSGATPPPAGAIPAADATPAPGPRGRPGALRTRRVAVTGAVAAVVIVALVVAGATVGSGGTPHSLGRAKNFMLGVLGHPGQRISLQAMADRPVIVNFFASWCPPCQKETPLIARFYRDTRGHPAIIGVDVNDPSSAGLAFVRRSGVTYPVATDPAPMKAAIAYGVAGLPVTFFLNARHIIVKRVYGAVTQAELVSGARQMAGRAG